MSGRYRGSGSASYHPRMLLGLLVYGYATGVFSSRKLERATYNSVAFRFIAANDHPDHDTIATFRRRFLAEIEALFVRVLLLAREMGVLKMGTVALDGTKIHANASRHSALSYEHAGKVEAQLKAEVADLMAKAEAADAADLPDGMSIPDELARREERLRKLAEARAKIEARAKERHAREQAEHEARLAARQAKAEASGKKPRGKPPDPPVEGPRPNDQINLTDEESRIMPVAGGGFDQCYNAQAAVAAGSLLVVASAVSQAPNDKQQLEPMLDKIEARAISALTVSRDIEGSCRRSLQRQEKLPHPRLEPLMTGPFRMGARDPMHPTRLRNSAVASAKVSSLQPLRPLSSGCEPPSMARSPGSLEYLDGIPNNIALSLAWLIEERGPHLLVQMFQQPDCPSNRQHHAQHNQGRRHPNHPACRGRNGAAVICLVIAQVQVFLRPPGPRSGRAWAIACWAIAAWL